MKCEQCETVVTRPQNPGGPPRRFCSDACRNEFHKLRLRDLRRRDSEKLAAIRKKKADKELEGL